MVMIKILKYWDRSEGIEPNGLYFVHDEDCADYLVKNIYGRGVWVPKKAAKRVKERLYRMKLSELAKCMKFLEMMRWKLILGHYQEVQVGRTCIRIQSPIEQFFLNQFPFYSPFCAVFSRKGVKNDEGVHICWCPMRPYEHPEWITLPLHPREGYWKKAHRSCILEKGSKPNSYRHRSELSLLQQVESIPVVEIMQHLKKIKLDPNLNKLFVMLWFHHIEWRVKEWEKAKGKKFT